MIYLFIILLYFYCIISISITLSLKIHGFSKSLYALGFFNLFASLTGFYCVVENVFGSLTTANKMILAFGFAFLMSSGFSILVGHLPDKVEPNKNPKLYKDSVTIQNGDKDVK